jgi:nitrate reductase beta subunit
MLESIVVEDDDSFLENLPYFYESVKKSADLKLKDVKEVTLLIKKQKRHLEICMNCEKKIKDEKGRKSSVKHYHFQEENFIFYENEDFIYEPIICEECLESSFDWLNNSCKYNKSVSFILVTIAIFIYSL